MIPSAPAHAPEPDAPETAPPPARAPRTLRSTRARAGAVARRHPLLTTVAVLLITAMVLVIGDAAVITSRIDRLDVAATSAAGSAAGSAADGTWLLIGTDSRADLPDGPDRYGTTAEAGAGSRADVLALVQPGEDGSATQVLVLPRDLTIGPDFFSEERLATSYLKGPQNTVDLLCGSLGIPVSHLVTVDMAQFARIIDSLGGLTVDVAEPIRDTHAGLDLKRAGSQRLSGIDALALVRSRHPEVLRDGTWTALSDVEGAQQRSHYSGVVMKALLGAVRADAQDPLALQRLAWSVSGNTSISSGTGVLDLLDLARSLASSGAAGIDVVDVPAPTVGDTFIAYPTDDTYAVLAEHGYAPGTCTTSS